MYEEMHDVIILTIKERNIIKEKNAFVHKWSLIRPWTCSY